MRERWFVCSGAAFRCQRCGSTTGCIPVSAMWRYCCKSGMIRDNGEAQGQHVETVVDLRDLLPSVEVEQRRSRSREAQLVLVLAMVMRNHRLPHAPASLCLQCLEPGQCTSDHERMAGQLWGATCLMYMPWHIVLMSSHESLLEWIANACLLVTGACSLAAYWRDRREMQENGARRRFKVVASLRSVAGLLSIFPFTYFLMMLINDSSWEPMREYMCCPNATLDPARCTSDCSERPPDFHGDAFTQVEECWGGGHVYNDYDPLHGIIVPVTCKDPALVMVPTGKVSHAERDENVAWDSGLVAWSVTGVMVFWAVLIVTWRESKAEPGLISEEEGGIQASAPAAEDSSRIGAHAEESKLLLKQLREAAESAGLGQVSIAAAGADDWKKFNSDELVMGMADDAGRGIGPFLNYPRGEPGLYRQVSIGMPAIKEEIELHGTEVDQECFDYVAYQEAGSSDKKFQNGWMRDRDPATGKVYPEREILDPAAPGGKRGMRLADFHAHEVSRLCQLTLEEVFVLRFYSTAGFRSINNPLRDQGRHRRGEAHGLAVLVFILSSAIKKLRAWAGTGDNKLKSQNLFRGMSNRKVFETFMQDGGTELAPMSTTSELWVALKYSQGGETATILWLRSSNFMDRGVDLSWISAYPHEQEFLYPALTYLKPINKEPLICVVGNVRYQIVEVAPQM